MKQLYQVLLSVNKEPHFEGDKDKYNFSFRRNGESGGSFGEFSTKEEITKSLSDWLFFNPGARPTNINFINKTKIKINLSKILSGFKRLRNRYYAGHKPEDEFNIKIDANGYVYCERHIMPYINVNNFDYEKADKKSKYKVSSITKTIEEFLARCEKEKKSPWGGEENPIPSKENTRFSNKSKYRQITLKSIFETKIPKILEPDANTRVKLRA